MAKARKKLMSKGIKKKWYKVFAPDYLNNVFIGECFVDKQEKLLNKTLTVTLNQLTHNPKDLQINVKFRCNQLKGNEGASTQLIKYYLMPATVKRLVRIKRDKIDDSFVCSTKDKILVRVKPLIITQHRVPEKKKTLVRKVTKEVLAEYFSKVDYNEWVMSVINRKVQSQIHEIVSRIVPLRVVEIRTFEITKRAVRVVKEGEFDISPFVRKEKKKEKGSEKKIEKKLKKEE